MPTLASLIPLFALIAVFALTRVALLHLPAARRHGAHGPTLPTVAGRLTNRRSS